MMEGTKRTQGVFFRASFVFCTIQTRLDKLTTRKLYYQSVCVFDNRTSAMLRMQYSGGTRLRSLTLVRCQRFKAMRGHYNFSRPVGPGLVTMDIEKTGHLGHQGYRISPNAYRHSISYYVKNLFSLVPTLARREFSILWLVGKTQVVGSPALGIASPTHSAGVHQGGVTGGRADGPAPAHVGGASCSCNGGGWVGGGGGGGDIGYNRSSLIRDTPNIPLKDGPKVCTVELSNLEQF